MWIKQQTIQEAKEKLYKRTKDERILWLNPFQLVNYCAGKKLCKKIDTDSVIYKFEYDTCTITDMVDLYRIFKKWDNRFNQEIALRILARPGDKPALENVKQIWDKYYNHRKPLTEIPQLKVLSRKFSGDISKYYHRFKIPKKNGGKRIIEAPTQELADIQRIILNKILYASYPRTMVNPANGFLPNKNILTNASVHQDARIIINLDLKDAFTSTTDKILLSALEEYFTKQGARILIDLCCVNSYLPQGAPTSPMLLNYSLLKTDRKISGLVKNVGWRYSRYADDLTFSCKKEEEPTTGTGTLIDKVTGIIKEYGYKVNENKVRVRRPKRAMEVTGLVLNSGKPTISRKVRRIIRAKVHNFITKGIGDLKEIQGHISYISLVHKNYANNLQKQLKTYKSQ